MNDLSVNAGVGSMIEKKGCECESVKFDTEQARHMTTEEVRAHFPRFFGNCMCGYSGIKYASYEHYLCGDW